LRPRAAVGDQQPTSSDRQPTASERPTADGERLAADGEQVTADGERMGDRRRCFWQGSGQCGVGFSPGG
jgi:hypothetical protein